MQKMPAPAHLSSGSRRANSDPVAVDSDIDTDRVGRGHGSAADQDAEQNHNEHGNSSHDRSSFTPVSPTRQGSRRSAPVLTAELAASFESEWAGARSTLDRMKAQRISGQDREDLIQEVAVRALLAWRDGRIQTNLQAWCVGTARHLAADLWRRRARDRLLEIAEPPPALAVEQEADGKLAVQGLARAWALLDAAERDLLLNPKPPTGATAVQRNRFYVALHRLRRRTRVLAESFTPVLLRVGRRLAPWLGDPSPLTTGTVAAITIGLHLGLGAVSPPPTPPAPTPPAATDGKQSDSVVQARSPGSVPPGLAEAHPRSLTGSLAAPAEPRVSARPGGHEIEGRIYNGDPERPPPLICIRRPDAAPLCIDYPIR